VLYDAAISLLSDQGMQLSSVTWCKVNEIWCKVNEMGLHSVWVSTVHLVVLNQVQERSGAIKEVSC